MNRALALNRIGKSLLVPVFSITEFAEQRAFCSNSAKAETLAESTRVAASVNSKTEQTIMFKPSEIVANAAAEAEAEVLDRIKKADLVENLFTELATLPTVRMGNALKVKEKISTMAAGGSQKLLVISDFDYTLSRFADEKGERLSTTHGVFDDNVMKINPALGQKFIDLRDKYFPIEFDPKLSDAEKIPHMEKWWSSSHNLIVNERFSKETIEEFVRNSRIVFKNGAEDFIQSLDARNVPLVVFSAGIGNIIEIYIEQKLGAVPRNTHFISNMILFDEQDKACGFSEPLIHTFCKNSSVIQKEASFFHEISGRTNVVLLGDSMGDIHMDVGVEKDGPTLKIGFFNGNINDESLLNHYIDVYDIVLIHDASLNIAQKIVDVINKNVIV